MHSIRFYLEHASAADKRKGKHSGNVFAAFVYSQPERGIHRGWFRSGNGHDWMIEGIGALTYEPDSPVCGVTASEGFIRGRCKRIGEVQARAIHPRLFARLDADAERERQRQQVAAA